MKHFFFSIVLTSVAMATPLASNQQSEAQDKVDDAVKEALDTAGVSYKNDADGNFLLDLKFKNSRSQKITIVSRRIVLGGDADGEEGDEIREIFSVAFTSKEPPSGELASQLLQENGSAKLGGWAVRKNGDKFETVYRAFVPADICEHELLPAVGLVALQADTLEKRHTNKDEN